MNKHEHISESLELFASEVIPGFKAIEAALARKKFMSMPEGKVIPVFLALGRGIVAGEKDPKKRLRFSSAAVSLDRFQFSADFEPFALHHF